MMDMEDWGPPEPVTPPSCVVCRSLLEAPDDEGWMRCPNGHGHFKGDTSDLDLELHNELQALYREDRAELADYEAVNGNGTHRVLGGL